MNWNDEGLLRSIVRLLHGGELDPSPSEPSDGAYPAMWISLVPDRQMMSEYIDGSGAGHVSFDVFLRYRSLSPADSLRAVRILEDTARRAVLSGEISLRTVPACVRADGSAALWSMRLEYCYITGAGEVSRGRAERYYINVSADGDPEWRRIGCGFCRFDITFRRDPDERRYIERRDTRASMNGVCKRRLSFALDRHADELLRRALLDGECEVLYVESSGRALKYDFVLTEVCYGDNVTGTLVSTGGAVCGKLGDDGEFVQAEEVSA